MPNRNAQFHDGPSACIVGTLAVCSKFERVFCKYKKITGSQPKAMTGILKVIAINNG